MKVIREWPVAPRAVCSAVVALILSFALFITLGLLPLLLQYVMHGFKYVYDAPAHGGAILLLSIPVSATLSVGAFVFLVSRLYRIISR